MQVIENTWPWRSQFSPCRMDNANKPYWMGKGHIQPILWPKRNVTQKHPPRKHQHIQDAAVHSPRRTASFASAARTGLDLRHGYSSALNLNRRWTKR